ncbi:hypothetical protein ACHAXS_002922 [Conticribra weissflogii]
MNTKYFATLVITLAMKSLVSSFQTLPGFFAKKTFATNQIEEFRRLDWRNSHSQLSSVIEHIEHQATIAAETWSVEATPFLDPDIASEIEQRFQDRGDVMVFRVVGGRRLSANSQKNSRGEGKRSRFVISHADLGMDAGTAESEFCTVIRVENVNIAASNTFPNALASIGIDLDDIGDVVKVDSSTVYLVVNPAVGKQCLRLLPKELVGAGIKLEIMESNEFMPDGEIQEMKLSRILERQMSRKKLERGYVQFS